VSGCGTQPTGRGAPPYDDGGDSASTRAMKIHTRYPALRLTFGLPLMAGSDKIPIATYVKYQALVIRALRTKRLPTGLQKVASKAVRDEVAGWISTEQSFGVTPVGRVHVDIRSVSTTTYSVIKLCYHDAKTFRTSSGLNDQPDETRSLGVIVGRRHQDWIVTAVAKLTQPLRNC